MALILCRAVLGVAIVPWVIVIKMALVALQIGAVSAIFVQPDDLSTIYLVRMWQIAVLVFSWEVHFSIIIVALPYLLVNGDFRW